MGFSYENATVVYGVLTQFGLRTFKFFFKKRSMEC